MLREAQVSAYSCKLSKVRRGIAPSEWLIMWTVVSSVGNSLRQLSRASMALLQGISAKVTIEAPAAIAICCFPLRLYVMGGA